MLDNYLGPILIIVFIVLQVLNSRKIVIKTQFSKIKAGMSLLISIGAIVMFWTDDFIFLTILFSLAILIIMYGFLPEGLSKEGIARFGVLEGSYDKYEQIEILSLNKKNIYVSFYTKGSEQRRKKGYKSGASFTFRFPKEVKEEDIIEFFEELGIESKINRNITELQFNAQ